MKRTLRSLAPLMACMMLSACGGNAMMNSAAYNSYTPSGPLVNGQPMNGTMVNGQSSLASLPQPNQAPNLSAPIPPAQQLPAQVAAQAAPRAAAAVVPNSRPAPTLGKVAAPVPAAASAPAAGAPKTAAPAAAPKAAAPAPAKAAAPAGPTAAELLAKVHQAVASLQSLSATVSTFEKGPNGTGTGKVQMLYRAGQVKLDVIASSDSSRLGVKLSFQSGGSQVRVRPSGVLSMVALNLAANDSKLLSGRKYQIPQIELMSTVNRLTQPGVHAKILGKTTFAGAEVIVIEVVGANNFDGSITKEHLGIDSQTFLPRIHEMYQGEELVYAGRVESLTVNPQLAANAFEV